MSKFEVICCKMNELTHLVKSVIFAVVYALMLPCYIDCIEGLQKPGGFVEALEFLFASPKEYTKALLVGVVLHILPWLLGISVVFSMVAAFLLDEERKIVLYIIDGILSIVMMVLNENMVHHVGALALVCACICLTLYAFVEGSNR